MRLVGFIVCLSLLGSLNAQEIISGKMTIDNYHQLVKWVENDSTYEKVSFYPKRNIQFRIDMGLSINSTERKEREFVDVRSSMTGRLAGYTVEEHRDRLGKTLTYKIVVDFGEGLVVPYLARVFFSGSRHVKSWSDKAFIPAEKITVDGNSYLLQEPSDKNRIDFSYYKTKPGYSNQ